MSQGVQTIFRYKNEDWTIDDLVKLSGVPKRRLWQRIKANNNVVTARMLDSKRMSTKRDKVNFNDLMRRL